MPAHLLAARTVEWLPAFAAAAYVAFVAVSLPALVRSLYWDSDAASAFVLGELLRGHGTVEIPRFGFWSSLWWLLATRELPGHRQLWEGTGYVFALSTVALLGWAMWRAAGRWAGVAASAVAIAVGPRALRSLVTVNFHTSTPFTAALLGAYLVTLIRSDSWLLAVAIGVLAGVNLASDPLLLIAGIAPFALGAGVLSVATRRRDIAGRAAILLAATFVCAVVTDRVLRALGYHVIPVGLELVGAADVVPNFIKLGKSIALVFGANHFFPGVYPVTPIRYAITLFSFAALGATLFSAVRLTVRRADPTVRAYACFWATAAVLIGLGYWLTNQGTGVGAGGGVNYVLVLAPAAGVGLGLVGARSFAARIIISLAIAAVGVVNVAAIGHGRAEESVRPHEYGPRLIRLLERNGLTRGYAPYPDAQSLTWQSGMRLFISPVQECNYRSRSRALCRFNFFTIDSWYEERPGPSFLIFDPPAGFVTKPPPTSAHPLRQIRLGPITVYVYPYDLARRIR